MSQGVRIPLATAQRVATFLFERWGMDSATCLVVGSVRRERPTVGDLEILAPLPQEAVRGGVAGPIGPEHDPLFRRINASMQHPWCHEGGALFAKPATEGPIDVIGDAVSGLAPGFRSLNLRVFGKAGPQDPVAELPVQVYRSTPANHGWMMVMRTGPAEFGQWFLHQWKLAHGIPVGNAAHPASLNGHLVDARRAVVPVLTEREAFDKAGLTYIEPRLRDAHVDKVHSIRREETR